MEPKSAIDLTDVWIGFTETLRLKGELPVEGKVAVLEFSKWKLTVNGCDHDVEIREGMRIPIKAMLTEYDGKINGLFNIKGGMFAMDMLHTLLDDLNEEYKRLRKGVE